MSWFWLLIIYENTITCTEISHPLQKPQVESWGIFKRCIIQNEGAVSQKKIGLGETYYFIYVKTIIVPFLWKAVVLLTFWVKTQELVSCCAYENLPIQQKQEASEKLTVPTFSENTFYTSAKKTKPKQKTTKLKKSFYWACSTTLQFLVLLGLDWDLSTGQLWMPVGTQKNCLCNYCSVIWVWGHGHWEEVLVSSVASPLVLNQHKVDSSLIQM